MAGAATEISPEAVVAVGVTVSGVDWVSVSFGVDKPSIDDGLRSGMLWTEGTLGSSGKSYILNLLTKFSYEVVQFCFLHPGMPHFQQVCCCPL